MMYPTTVWVVVDKDTEGKPLGFEKTRDNKFFMNEYDAHHYTFGNQSQTVVQCVIMTGADFNVLVCDAIR